MIPPLKTPESQKITGDWVLFHPVYTPSELKAVDVSEACGAPRSYLTILRPQVLHRSPQTLSDKFAYGLVRLCRSVHIATLKREFFFIRIAGGSTLSLVISKSRSRTD